MRSRGGTDRSSGGRHLRRAMASIGAVVALALLAAPGAAAERPLEQAPGYFPLERFELLPSESLNLEINLSRNLLVLVAGAMADEDPEFAALVEGLEGIRVRSAPAAALDLERLRGKLTEATGWLEANGWETMLRYRDEEEVYIYTRISAGSMVGLALMAMEPGGEVVVVNIVGPLDMRLLAGLAESLDLPQLGLATEEPTKDEEEPR